MMKRTVLFSFLCWLIAISAAADIRITAEVSPSTVGIGEAFRLEYKVNSLEAGQIRPGAFDGFKVLNGPAVSSYTSYQITNGQARSESSKTYTYILSATQEGTFTLPAATVTVDGRTYKSNTVRIKVVKDSGRSVSGGNIATEEPAMRTRGGVTNKDLFITVTANKTKVFEQEPIVLTYKVYTLVNLNQLSGKMPDLKGFLSQEVPLPSQKTFSLERYNGQLYRATTWSQYVLFPQQTGKLTVPSIRFEGTVVMENPYVDPIDAFFNGSDYTVKVVRQTPTIDIEVNPLPQPKPQNFSGAVGKLDMSAKIVTTEPKTNEAMTLRLTISGVGNMKLIKAPKVSFPTSFEVYDPKVQDKTSLTEQGIAGQMVYDYLVIPRQKGHYEIPPIEFSFFDINEGQYKTLKTETLSVDVAQGTKSDAEADREIQFRNSDIRPIHVDDGMSGAVSFWGTASYVSAFVILVLVFVVAVVLTRSHLKANADVVGRKGREAGKNARLRMAKAHSMLDHNQPHAFYEETEKALHGYVTDKFNIPTAQLSREKMMQTLEESGVSSDTVGCFVQTLEKCELARYAPNSDNQQMVELYEQAVETLSNIEQELKSRKKKR